MKVGIVGVGAIGGFIAARMQQAGIGVKALARGPTLAALRERGLTIEEGGRSHTVPIEASDDASALGRVDMLVLATKAHALADAAGACVPMLRPGTIIVPAINGVPWWFFLGENSGPLAGRPVRVVDPDGHLQAALPFSQVLGCVLHMSVQNVGPAHVRPVFGQRVLLGEPAGATPEPSARLAFAAEAFESAGFEVDIGGDIRTHAWYKLWGNMTMNPVTALAGVTGDKVLDDPLVDAFCRAIMREAADVGARIGCRIEQTPEARNEVTRRLGAFKTSMLQDVQAGRSIEIDALLTAVREIAQALAVPTPNLDALLGLTRLFARQRGLYPPA